jgi:hypothetical protein
LTQSLIAWAIDSIANPQLNDDPGTIIPFPDETFGLSLSLIKAWFAEKGCSLFKSHKTEQGQV